MRYFCFPKNKVHSLVQSEQYKEILDNFLDSRHVELNGVASKLNWSWSETMWKPEKDQILVESFKDKDSSSKQKGDLESGL